MGINEIKNMRFLGQIREIIIFFADPGWWLAVKSDAYQDYIYFTTARGDLRIFKTLDAANRSVVEILRKDPSVILDADLRTMPSVRIVN